MASHPLAGHDIPRALCGLMAVVAEVRDHHEAAQATVHHVAELMHADAAAVVAVDPSTGEPEVLAQQSYPDDVLAHVISSRFRLHDPGIKALAAGPGRRGATWRDFDFDYATTPTATDVLLPAGFRGGVSILLVTGAGRRVGELHASTGAADGPQQEVVDWLGEFAPSLACALDPASAALAALSAAPPDAECALIDVHGALVEVPGARLGTRLHPGSPLWTTLTALLDTLPVQRAHADHRWLDEAGTACRVTTTPTASGTVVTITESPLPFRLTNRELEVLTWVTRGATNRRVASALHLSERTVAHHVERILGKLGVENRAAAARAVLQHGLALLSS